MIYVCLGGASYRSPRMAGAKEFDEQLVLQLLSLMMTISLGDFQISQARAAVDPSLLVGPN